MNILLDENIPVQLRRALNRHIVASVNDAPLGWKNIQNGRLLAEMEGKFDLLITADRNIYAQQNMSGRKIAILVLPTNRRRDVLALSERIGDIIDSMKPEEYATLSIDGVLSKRSFHND